MSDKTAELHFIENWESKIKKSPYKLFEYFIFSNRQIKIWSIVEVKTMDNIFKKAKVLKKPSYTDDFWKERFRGFLILEIDGNKTVAHVDNVMKR